MCPKYSPLATRLRPPPSTPPLCPRRSVPRTRARPRRRGRFHVTIAAHALKLDSYRSQQGGQTSYRIGERGRDRHLAAQRAFAGVECVDVARHPGRHFPRGDRARIKKRAMHVRAGRVDAAAAAGRGHARHLAPRRRGSSTRDVQRPGWAPLHQTLCCSCWTACRNALMSAGDFKW